MDKPLCRLCNHRHYAQEAHIWASRDFAVFIDEVAPVSKEAVEVAKNFKSPAVLDGVEIDGPDGLLLTHQTEIPNGVWPATTSRENRSRYRSPESAEKYRARMRKYMADRRAVKD